MIEKLPNFHIPNIPTIPKIDFPIIDFPTLEMPELHIPIDKSRYPAWWTYEAVMKYIDDFQSKLDNETEIWMHLVSFWGGTVFHLRDIDYEEPSIITFYWVNERSEPVQLIQNLAQMSILLVGVKKIGEEPVRIWFKTD